MGKSSKIAREEKEKSNDVHCTLDHGNMCNV